MPPLIPMVAELALCHGVEYCSGLSLKGVPLLQQARHKLPQEAQSVLMLLFPYYTGPMEGRNISRYAAVPDYHIVAMVILRDIARELETQYPRNRFVPLIDASPIPEVAAAAACGLGVVGSHGLLINEKYGSYVFIGAIATDIPLPMGKEIKGCSRCGLCSAKCPGGAIGCGVEKQRCLSHITQLKGELSPQACDLIRQQGFGWGCDVCLDICPMNRKALTPIMGFYEDNITILSPETLPQLRNHACGWRGESVLRRNMKIIQK